MTVILYFAGHGNDEGLLFCGKDLKDGPPVCDENLKKGLLTFEVLIDILIE